MYSRILEIPTKLSIAFESNGNGSMGFLVELPGSFVRGKTEEEALLKVNLEIQSYLSWLGVGPIPKFEPPAVVQRYSCNSFVDDGDSEILLDADKKPLSRQRNPLPNEERINGLAIYASQCTTAKDETCILSVILGKRAPASCRIVLSHDLNFW